MNEPDQTDYSVLDRNSDQQEDFSAIATSAAATRNGTHEQNNPGMEKPYTPPSIDLDPPIIII